MAQSLALHTEFKTLEKQLLCRDFISRVSVSPRFDFRSAARITQGFVGKSAFAVSSPISLFGP